MRVWGHLLIAADAEFPLAAEVAFYIGKAKV